MKVMIHRQILKDIEEWSKRQNRKPLVLRGARQVGKTTLVDEFGKQFDIYIKLNLEQSADAAIFGIDTKKLFQDGADLRFAFAAIALDNHHALGFVRGQQKIADELLEHRDVLWIKQLIKKSDPLCWHWCIRIVDHRESCADNLPNSIIKCTIQKQRAVFQMNAIFFRWKLWNICSDFQHLDDVFDFVGNTSANVEVNFLKDGFFQWCAVLHSTIWREERTLTENQLMGLQKRGTE